MKNNNPSGPRLATFADRLTTIRGRSGLSLRETAKRVGVTYQYLWRLEKGMQEGPGFELVCRLADIFGVPVTEFRHNYFPNSEKSA